MPFKLDESVLRRLLAQNHFNLPAGERVLLFGLRGALPVASNDWALGEEKQIADAAVDHRHPRCTLGVLHLDSRKLMVCPGSTVPAQEFIDASVALGGKNTNQLLEGLLAFNKGDHSSKEKPQNAHAAFLEATEFPIQRSANDGRYDDQDAIRMEWPGDNIHCGYCGGPNAEFRSSQGCQVVSGMPRRPLLADTKDSGAWPRFRDAAYASGQTKFSYLLLKGSTAGAAATAAKDTLAVTLRFGSSGDLVTRLQEALKAKGFLTGTADGQFGGGTLKALLAFQGQAGGFGDGVCGPRTAEALGIADWPKV